MARKKKVATQDEVLEFFTTVMRREADDGNVKLSEAMSAADKLYKHFRETSMSEDDGRETGVVLLPMLRDNVQQDKKGD